MCYFFRIDKQQVSNTRSNLQTLWMMLCLQVVVASPTHIVVIALNVHVLMFPIAQEVNNVLDKGHTGYFGKKGSSLHCVGQY